MPDGVIVPYAQVAAGAGELMTGLNKGVIEATKSVMCPLYKNYPGYMTGQNFGSPLADASDALFQQVCNTPENPPPERLPPGFNGGNCVNVKYRVNFIGNTGQGQFSGFSDVFGPVQGISKENITNPQGQPALNFFLIGGINPDNGVRDKVSLVFNAPPDSFYTITSVTTPFGGTDNCGNTPNRFPIITPPDVALNLNVPVTLAPNLTVNAPVTVFAPFNNFAPSLKLGDFNIDFDLGGIKISPNIDINFNPANPVSKPPQQPSPGQQPQDRDYTEILSLIVRYLRRLRECQDCDLDYNFFTVQSTANQSGELLPPSGSVIVAVGFNITKSPSNPKREAGFNAPDVLYAGWGWFSGNGYMYERTPMDSAFKLFIAPRKPAIKSFCWTLRKGYEGVAVLTYKQLKNPLPPLP